MSAPRLLTALLGRCTSAAELRQLGVLHGRNMDALHQAQMCVLSGRFRAPDVYLQHAPVWVKAQPGTLGRGARQAANTLNAAAKLSLLAAQHPLVMEVARAAASDAPSFNAQEAANSLWAVAKLGLADMAVVGPLSKAAVRLAPEMNAQGAANSLHAVAKLGLADVAIVGPLSKAAARLAPEMNAQNAANSLWASKT
jgi:hypothetical protein